VDLIKVSMPNNFLTRHHVLTSRSSFLRSLTRRGLRGVKLVIFDAHEGLKAATTKVSRAT
jgi:transposase-like protein